MNSATNGCSDFREELQRILRVSDMLCTGHAWLRDRYALRALILDLLILIISVWLVALAFVNETTARRLTPATVEPQIWMGLLAVLTFVLSVIQIKVDWKGRSDAHQRSFDIYFDVKRQATYLLQTSGTLARPDCESVLVRYDVAAQFGTHIGERDFLRIKQRHKIKVAISKQMDTHPAASILLLKLKLWMRDNWHPDNHA